MQQVDVITDWKILRSGDCSFLLHMLVTSRGFTGKGKLRLVFVALIFGENIYSLYTMMVGEKGGAWGLRYSVSLGA